MSFKERGSRSPSSCLPPPFCAHAADCNSSFPNCPASTESSPNHPAGPIAWNGTVFAVAHDTPGVPVTVSLYERETSTSCGPRRPSRARRSAGGLKLITDGSKFAVVFFTPGGIDRVSGGLVGRFFPIGRPRETIGDHTVLFTESELDATYKRRRPIRGTSSYSIPFQLRRRHLADVVPARPSNGPPLVNGRAALQTFVFPRGPSADRRGGETGGDGPSPGFAANGGHSDAPNLVIYGRLDHLPDQHDPRLRDGEAARAHVDRKRSFALAYQAPGRRAVQSSAGLRVNSAGTVNECRSTPADRHRRRRPCRWPSGLESDALRMGDRVHTTRQSAAISFSGRLSHPAV